MESPHERSAISVRHSHPAAWFTRSVDGQSVQQAIIDLPQPVQRRSQTFGQVARLKARDDQSQLGISKLAITADLVRGRILIAFVEGDIINGIHT
jgi:hypothetical protein